MHASLEFVHNYFYDIFASIESYKTYILYASARRKGGVMMRIRAAQAAALRYTCERYSECSEAAEQVGIIIQNAPSFV